MSPVVERFWTPDVSGTLQSAAARSHNGDSTAVLRVSGGRFGVGVQTRDGVFHLLNNAVVRGSFSRSDTLCVAERVDPANGTSCLSWKPSSAGGTSYDANVSYSPMGDEIFFSVYPYSSTREIKEWYPCMARMPAGATLVGLEPQPYDRCRDLKFSGASGASEVFGVRTRGGLLRQVPTLGTHVVRFIGISEDGREAAVYDELSSSNETYGWRVNEIIESDGTRRLVMLWDQIASSPSSECRLRYRDLFTGAESLSAPCSDPYRALFVPFSANHAPASH